MKPIIRLFVVILALSTGAGWAAAQEAARAEITFRVSRGDTFGNLFVDWYEAWQQNRIVVVRDGRPVSSPDILLEGATVKVSGAVSLTPRAQARVIGLERHRAELIRRLDAVDERLAGSPRGPELLAKCRRSIAELGEFPQRAAEVGWQLDKLEELVLVQSLDISKAPSKAPRRNTGHIARAPWLAGTAAVLLVVMVWWISYGRKSEMQVATRRYRDAACSFQAIR